MSETTVDAPPLRAGVIGLGYIGSGVSVSLARRGRVPVVYDIRPDAADGLENVPAAVASAAAVAREADVILVAVVDAAQAREVLTGTDGILAGARAGTIVVLLSTVAVAEVHDLARVAATAGVELLDCGVTPGNKASSNGMVAIVGGDEATVERARPVLEDFAKKVVHCGPLGAGMATKIARNVVTYGTWRVIHEAAMLAQASGAGVENLIDVIQTADPEGETLMMLLAMRGHRIGPVTDDEERAHLVYVGGLMLKDLAAAQELAVEQDIKVPLVDLTRRVGLQTFGLEQESA